VKDPDEFAEPFGQAQGVILGPLQAHLHDRIKVGAVERLLSGGATCDCPIGTMLRVIYGIRRNQAPRGANGVVGEVYTRKCLLRAPFLVGVLGRRGSVVSGLPRPKP
jgi:hypothetical protein